MTETFLRLNTAGEAEIERPDAETLVSGDPEFTTWNIEDRDGLFCGMWRATPGKWKVRFAEWEFCHFLEGYSILTRDDGEVFHLRAGESFIIRPGFTGTWEVVETTLKEYVIRA